MGVISIAIILTANLANHTKAVTVPAILLVAMMHFVLTESMFMVILVLLTHQPDIFNLSHKTLKATFVLFK